MRVNQDTRTIRRGEWFVPVKGDNFDGHAFISAALKKGAAGVIELPQLYDLARKKLAKINPVVVGITGSYGKTTTKELIYRILNSRSPSFRIKENINTPLGIAIEVVNNLKPRHKFFIAELGMDHLGEIKESCEIIHPTVGVVTNVGEMHLEKLGTRENILKAKSELLEALPHEGVAVLNADDPSVIKMANRFSGRKIWFGPSDDDKRPADLSGVDLKLLGPANQSNALAAIAVGRIFKIPPADIRAVLESIKPIPGRLAVSHVGGGVKVIDDTYNAGPRSVEVALQVLKSFPAKRRIAILGDMLELGNAQEKAHLDIAKLIADSADIFVPIGERMEHGAALAGVKTQPLRDLNLKRGDVVLVKGSRGMKMERIVVALKKGAVGRFAGLAVSIIP